MRRHLTDVDVSGDAGKLLGAFNGNLPEGPPRGKGLMQLVAAVKRQPAIEGEHLEHLQRCRDCKCRLDDRIAAELGGGLLIHERVQDDTAFVLDRLYEGMLIRRAQTGDKQAWESLVRKHQSNLTGFCERVCRRHTGAEAADVAQKAWLRVHAAIGHFDTARGTSFGAYLKVTAARLAVADARRAQKRTKLAQDIHEQLRMLAPEALRPEDPVEVADTLKNVTELCSRILDRREQHILYQRVFCEGSFNQIGELHGISPKQARAIFARARKRVCEQLKRRGLG
jgi:RNA polymerase sigma factor (sigma-70 family)